MANTTIYICFFNIACVLANGIARDAVTKPAFKRQGGNQAEFRQQPLNIKRLFVGHTGKEGVLRLRSGTPAARGQQGRSPLLPSAYGGEEAGFNLQLGRAHLPSVTA